MSEKSFKERIDDVFNNLSLVNEIHYVKVALDEAAEEADAEITRLKKRMQALETDLSLATKFADSVCGGEAERILMSLLAWKPTAHGLPSAVSPEGEDFFVKIRATLGKHEVYITETATFFPHGKRWEIFSTGESCYPVAYMPIPEYNPESGDESE